MLDLLEMDLEDDDPQKVRGAAGSGENNGENAKISCLGSNPGLVHQRHSFQPSALDLFVVNIINK